MKMKKITLALAGVMAAAAFAPEASALPLFARQTGMACSACHFQHFPMLNSFGRSFKSAGYTLMGSQPLVEGDNISLPSTLNMAVLTTAGYVKTDGTTAGGKAANVTTPAQGSIYVPGTNGEFSLFIGGRVSDHVGALAEVGLTQFGGMGAGVTSAKIPMFWDVADDVKAGVVLFTTDGQGASYGFETLNTGANAIHTMLFSGGDANGSITPTLSAQQYIGTAAAATGAALVVNSSMGFINVTKFHQVSGNVSVPNSGAAFTGAKLGSTYVRVAGTFDLAGFDSAVGIQNWSGSSADTAGASALLNGTAAGAPNVETRATAIDGQMQGEMGGMPVGFYASYATAPVSAGGNNAFNMGGVQTKKSLNFSAEVGVIPEKATLGFGIRRASDGAASGTDGDNAWLLDGSYKLAQNVMLQLVYTSQSGSAWNGRTGGKQTAVNLATLF